jgi:ribonucleoside-diphosphate reductase alpha chain
MFAEIKTESDRVSKLLANERGACPDAADYGIMERYAFPTNWRLPQPPAFRLSVAIPARGIEPFAANSFMQKTLSGSFNVRNKNLVKLLEEKGQNTDDVWSSITVNEGSVQHLDFLTEDEKAGVQNRL